MKIRTKLIIGIVIMIIIPIFVVAPSVDALFNHYFFSLTDGLASPNNEFNNYLIITDRLVREIEDNNKGGYTETEIIDFMKSFDEKNLSKFYRFYVTKGDRIIMWNSVPKADSRYVEYESESEIHTQSNEMTEVDILDRGYGIGIASFIYEDGMVGKVAIYFVPSYFYNGLKLYNVAIITTMGISIILIAIILLIWISRTMKKPLDELEVATVALIDGNHDKSIAMTGRGDFVSLANRIDQLRISLNNSLLSQKKLEEEKSKIISNISHDIRTPLTSIRAYSQGIRDGIANTPELMNEYLEVIEGRVEVVENILNDLKLLDEQDSKISKYNKVKVEYHSFLKDVVNDLSLDVKQVNGEISIDLQDDVYFIYADVEKLYRVFANIIGNSIKYKSNLPLKIHINMRRQQNLIVVRIEDNGLGVSEENINKIFDRFFMVDEARNQNISSSGLGLSICREIINDHDGIIQGVYKDKGLIIDIRLPVINH